MAIRLTMSMHSIPQIITALCLLCTGAAVAVAATPAASSKQSAPAKQPQPTAKAANGAAAPGTPTARDFAAWYEHFRTQKGLAAKGEACIRSKTCVSDESDFLRHAEAAYTTQKAIEGYALAGNLDAAYYAGRIAFDLAIAFDEEFKIYAGFKDERYLDAGRRFVELSDRETRRARDFLYPAAYAHRPESCLLMGEVIEYDKLGTAETPAGVFYYCASREYYLLGQRDLAIKAYGGMLRTMHPQDPMIIEMHARLFNQQPQNFWRPITPITDTKPAAAPKAAQSQPKR
jgi:hypothetical protein